MKNGQVNLTTLSKAQTAIKIQERTTGQKVSLETKAQIVEQLENKSSEQTDKMLMNLLPEAATQMKQERKIVLDAETTRYFLNFDGEIQNNLKRAKEILSHKMSYASDTDVIAYALNFMLEKLDPLRKVDFKKKTTQENVISDKNPKHSTSAAEAMCVKNSSKAAVRRSVIRRHLGQCSYTDSVTGHACMSRYQIEVDHIYPKALGGSDAPDNLRPLCKQHNLMMAERVFGRKLINQYRK